MRREGGREGGREASQKWERRGKRAPWYGSSTRQASQPVTPSYAAALPDLRSRKVKGWRPRGRDAPSFQLGIMGP